MSALDALIKDMYTRAMLIILAVFMTVAVIGFVGFRLYEGMRLQRQVAVIDAEIQNIKNQLNIHTDIDAQRIDIIEAFVFGQISTDVAEMKKNPLPQVRVVEPTWMRMRDQRIRERLERLEAWRMSLQR